MHIPLAYKYNILEGAIDKVQCGFLLIYAPTLYSAVYLLHAPAPTPIKIGFGEVRCGAVRCGSCGYVGCVGKAYTPSFYIIICGHAPLT